jgi:hypothetical protein
LNGGIIGKNAKLLLKVIKELFKKYQLAIIQPNVNYVINNNPGHIDSHG